MTAGPAVIRVAPATISQADVARARSAVGCEFPHRAPAWNERPDPSAIAHFAYGYGDDNPLWHSRPHGGRTRWHDQIAPPLFLISTGSDVATRGTPADLRPSLRGVFKGTSRLHVQSSWTWYQPIYPGDLVFRSGRRLTRVTVGRQGRRRAVHQSYDVAYVNHAGRLVARQADTFANVEPPTADGSAQDPHGMQAGKRARRQLARYGPNERQEIDAGYARAAARGAETRTWESVQPGEELPPVVKGPLTVVDIIAMHQGMGWGGMPVGPFKYGWDGRRRSPGYYELDDDGIHQVVQRVHWDADYARRTGFPAPYDYGQMRACWMSQAVTDWMGDDAWLWKLTVDYHRLNLLGDTHWCTGKVVQRGIVQRHHVAVVELTATNQLDEVTTTGTATIVLPEDRESSVRLPRPTVAKEADALARFDLRRPQARQ